MEDVLNDGRRKIWANKQGKMADMGNNEEKKKEVLKKTYVIEYTY